MADTTHAVLRDQLQEERDRLRDQLQRLGHGAGARARLRRELRRLGAGHRRARRGRGARRSARRDPEGDRGRPRQVRRRHLRRVRELPPAHRRSPARGDAGGARSASTAFATTLSPSHRRCREHRLRAGGHLLRLPGRRGDPPRDQPRRRRVVVRRRHREAGRPPHAQPDPAHRPGRVDRDAGDGRAARRCRCSRGRSRCR